ERFGEHAAIHVGRDRSSHEMEDRRREVYDAGSPEVTPVRDRRAGEQQYTIAAMRSRLWDGHELADDPRAHVVVDEAQRIRIDLRTVPLSRDVLVVSPGDDQVGRLVQEGTRIQFLGTVDAADDRL